MNINVEDRIWTDNRLTLHDKILFGLIDMEDVGNEVGCTLSNSELASLCGCSESLVTKSISKLTNLEYLKILKYDGRVRYLGTYIKNDSRIIPQPTTPTIIKLGYIYIFRSNDMYKIGTSKNASRRFIDLDNGPYPLEKVFISKQLQNPYRIEKYLHHKFSNNKVNGEWFRLSEPQLNEAIRYLENI